jgi:uncharacterized protein (DUF433 family)
MDHIDFTYTVPLAYEEDGTIRIRGSRVTLDSILHAFRQGATAEQIQDSFPSVSLREIYGAIAYYFEHQGQIETYLKEQEQAAQAIKRALESHPDVSAFRERIRTRRKQKGQD